MEQSQNYPPSKQQRQQQKLIQNSYTFYGKTNNTKHDRKEMLARKVKLHYHLQHYRENVEQIDEQKNVYGQHEKPENERATGKESREE